MIQPILSNRTEDIELECVFQRLRLVFDPRGNMENFPLANRDLLTGDEKLESALQDVGHLLALMRVHRHETAALQIDLRDHFALTAHDLAREHFGHLFERNLVPSTKPNRLCAHGDGSIYQRKRML